MTLNQTQYAAHRKQLGLPGGHLNSVQNAIKSGRLDGALTPDGKAIADVELADRLWEANTRHNRRPKTGPTSQGGRTAQSAQPVVTVEETKPNITDIGEDTAIPPIAESLAAKEYYNAELAKRKLATEQGQYLEIAVVRRAVERRYRVAQSHLLGLSSKLASQLSREDHLRIGPVVKRVVRQVLDEIADEERNA